MTRRQPITKSVAPGPILLLCAALVASLAMAPPSAAAEHEVRQKVVVVGDEEGAGPTWIRAVARRGFLGVNLLDLTPELRLHFGVPEDQGVLVSGVSDDAPAAAAGVEVGDVITAVDSDPVRSAGQLARRVGERGEGDTVELEVWRDGIRLTLSATLTERERPQLELGQFFWKGEEGEEPTIFRIDPGSGDRVIAIDPESISESVRRLVERLEESELTERMRSRSWQREDLEQRIRELEERLLEMEERLRERADDGS